MNKLKQSFKELKQNTPRHVQWLLLIAAFIVVLILLTLLLRGGKQETTTSAQNVDAAIVIDPDSLDWSAANVGEKQSQNFVISANAPVQIDDVRLSKEIDGLAKPKTTCTNIGQINSQVTCTISVEYEPKAAMETTALSIFVDWRGAGQPENMVRNEKITVAIGAHAAAVVTPEPEPYSAEASAGNPESPAPSTQSPLEKEIEELAREDIFKEPASAEAPADKPESPAPTPAPTDCSEFAFPGYNMAGQQFGWIRPERGGYNFHPFSDKSCANPTGTYNPDNGIITDDAGKKIGTDAEHIGYGTTNDGVLPQLSNAPAARSVNRAQQLTTDALVPAGKSARVFSAPAPENLMISSGGSVVSSQPYDRTFILRQYKPIPATIVSEIRADARLLSADHKLPVIATVDRNVYSDNGRTIIIPTGTTLYGYVTGDVPGPYKAIGRMEVRWYQFVRPDGVEFNFGGDDMDPFSADAQGRVGVPGRGSTDYMEQFVMPMLTAVVPAAVNMIAPISDTFVNQIDLDNNTVTQSGQTRSSELAKNEIITAWNQVAQKLLVDMMDNTVPPFSIAAGTRITVFSPMDLQVTCGGGNDKKCAISPYGENKRATPGHNVTMGASPENAGSMVGQVRSFNLGQYCAPNGQVKDGMADAIRDAGYDYRTVLFACQSSQYQAINNAKQAAVYQNQQQTGYAAQGAVSGAAGGTAEQQKQYNEQVLGLKYNDDGTIQNPFDAPAAPAVATLTCPDDGTLPDANGCCTGETYTDMGDQGFNCCPAGGGDCFPPMI